MPIDFQSESGDTHEKKQHSAKLLIKILRLDYLMASAKHPTDGQGHFLLHREAYMWLLLAFQSAGRADEVAS